MLEALLVADDLDGDHHLVLVVKALQGLAEATRSKLVQDFKSEGQVVLHDDLVVTTLIVEAEVVAKERARLDLVCLQTQKVDLLVVLNLNFFVICHTLVLEKMQGLARRHREMHFINSD